MLIYIISDGRIGNIFLLEQVEMLPKNAFGQTGTTK